MLMPKVIDGRFCADLHLGGGVRHRFLWIYPGSFFMGSPEGEAGRFVDEGPRHEVTLTEGFWIGEAPCTQALWEAVMGENPSRFRSPDRPVENVSWDDCQDFLSRLNYRFRGLGARLPTEAQWEYACRAGTDTATWLGDLEILGMNNAPGLDPIAWYGGNSGVDFDLAEGEGHDTSGWTEMQVPAQRRAGTRRVKAKAPNPWGLYDMLGNVWEWCSDRSRELALELYPRGHRIDPPGSRAGSNRILRGGSWNSDARLVRAASRLAFEPGSRYDDVGFRLCTRANICRSGGTVDAADLKSAAAKA